ncbi:uncharacterized protein LOC143473820 isoform X4 [Brachyhypopomus gauderio]|uniref:uncharacterized protein LOC143473820 isoform X4 n=1 Tax=Brachyhypopomus gauderio TaxID=698409 RepID=UPI004042F112
MPRPNIAAGSPANPVKFLGQDYQQLQQEYNRKKEKYSDEKFPADNCSIGTELLSNNNISNVVWKRPSELVKDPCLVVDGESRFDFSQGHLGNCWFLAAIGAITFRKDIMNEVVPQDQSFGKDYAGIFHFRFWRSGQWTDVVIDDKLPTVSEKLIFVNCKTHNEFWPALLEKAYAKVCGSYSAMKGGCVSDALRDVSGGKCNIFVLRRAPPDLWDIMDQAVKNKALMGCGTPHGATSANTVLPCGLVEGHAYTVTGVTKLMAEGQEVKLVRLFNPWGHGEWNRDWSDISPLWNKVNEEDRKKWLENKNNGEFWTLFTGDWSPPEKRVYNIPGVSPHMMQLIVDYAYTLSVPINEDNVEELLAAADQFLVSGLVRSCCQFLEAQLGVENCIGIHKLADTYWCPDLLQKAHLFILHHFEEVARVSEEFLEVPLTQLSGIIEKDDLNVKQEEVVFEAVLRWVSHAPQERNEYIAILLSKVRMALMKSEYFMNNVKGNALLEDSEDCKPIITNALKAMSDLNMNGPSNSDFRNPLSRPRLPYTILLAIGGWSGGSPTNSIEAYDARADGWVNVTLEEESQRAYHGAAYLNGFVYIVGGFDSDDYFSSVRKLNPVTRTWHQVAPMHSRRCYVSVAVLNNCIYAMGGFDGYVRINTAERYEPANNKWSMIRPMNEQRSDASATTLHGKVYICGGFNGNECLLTAEVYNPEMNQWSLIAPMRSRRSGVGVITYGEEVYAVGGFDGVNRLRSVEAYNPMTNTWRDMPAMINTRSNFGIEVVDDLLFVVGGFNGVTTTFKVERYDGQTEEWKEVHHMGVSRSALSCCVVPGLPNVVQYTAPRDLPEDDHRD